MSAADGHVIIRTAADNSQLEKDLAKATKSVEKLETEIDKTTQKRVAANERSSILGASIEGDMRKLQGLKDHLADLQAMAKDKTLSPDAREAVSAQIPSVRADVADQQARVRSLQAEWNKVTGAVERYDAKLTEATGELHRQKAAAGKLEEQLRRESGPINSIINGVGKRVDKLGKRITGMIKRVFVFTMITKALRGVRSWLGNIISTNDEATSAMARFQAALLTMAQPLVGVIVPAFTALVNVLTRAITAIAGFLAMLRGQTINQSKDAAKKLNEEAAAIKKTGEEAKKASGFLAGFDEINSVPDDNAGAAGAGTKSLDFGFDTSQMDTDFGKLLTWIKLIAAALLGWKLGKGFKDSLKKSLGLFVAISGAIEFAKGAWDAWQDGLNWDNFKQMLVGMALAVAGLGIAFGPVGAAIGAIVGGLAMLGVAFKDAMTNGWNLQNVLLAIAGILSAGLGIAILTGSWIPLLIAGIASVLLAITVATGHGAELIEGVKQVLQGLVDFAVGIFTGDMERAMAGIVGIFDGLKVAVGAIIDGIKDFLLNFLTWLDEKTGGKLHGIIQFAKDLITGFFDGIKATAGEFVESLKEIFSGITKFLAGIFTVDFDLAMDGIQDIIRGLINSVSSLLTGGVNMIIRAVNWIIAQLNKIKIEAPDWVPGIGGKSAGFNIAPLSEMQVPRLATGAVIPPNREFMAVLGDQRNGNNIETPEDLLRKIYREEGGAANAEVLSILQAILEAIRDGKVLMVDKRQLGKVVQEALGQMARASGTAVLQL